MATSQALDPPVDRSDHSDKLESWKAIAAYLERGVTTVQRWERDEGLPVHRLQHDSLGSIYAFKHELEAWRLKRAIPTETDERSSPGAALLATLRAKAWRPTILAGAALLLAAGIGVGVGRFGAPRTPNAVRHLTIVPPSTAPLVTNGLDRNLAITPDGSSIVYVGGTGTPRLFLRALDRLDATPIVGVLSPRYPFFSPDGQWIGFFEGFASLKKVPITGGPATELTYVNIGGDSGPRGASWQADQIAFAVGSRLFRVSAEGGTPEVLAVADHGKGEAAFWWPEFLPGGRALLLTIVPSGDWSEKGSKGAVANAQVAVFDLQTRKRKILFEGGSHARYLDSGHLVYAAEGALKAVAFDLRELAIVGSPETVLPEVAMTRGGGADFDVARDGTLVYAQGDVESDLVTLTWVDRRGNEEPTEAPSFSYRYPRLSPDGGRVAVGSPRDLGVWDFSTRKLTWFGIGYSTYPVWMPDGRRLIFASTREGAANIYQQAIDAAEPPTRLTTSQYNQFPSTVSPDGNYLVFRQDSTSSDLMLLDLQKGRVEPLIQTPFQEINADFSPDGRLLAYQSNESGQYEVYVQLFSSTSGKNSRVLIARGTRPQWARTGQELFYLSPTGDVMSLPIQQQGSAFTVGSVRTLIDGPFYLISGLGGRAYDASPDSTRFLAMKSPQHSGASSPSRNLQVVLNWYEELKRIGPYR